MSVNTPGPLSSPSPSSSSPLASLLHPNKRLRTASYSPTSSSSPLHSTLTPSSPFSRSSSLLRAHSSNAATVSAPPSPFLPAPLDKSLVEDLKTGAIHIWWFFEDKVPEDVIALAEREWLVPLDFLSPGRARVDSVRRERVRTKLLIRGILSRYLTADAGSLVHPSDIPFTWYRRGKPKLAPGWGIRDEATGRKREIWFNLTHTGGAMGLALGLDHEIGLDVERRDRVMRFDPLKLVKSQMHELEYEQLTAYSSALFAASPLSPEQRQEELESSSASSKRGPTVPPSVLRPVTERLMWHWVLKESFCKATGMGINAAPSLKGHAALLHKDLDPSPIARGLSSALPSAPLHPDLHRVELRYDDRRMEVLRDDPLPPASSYEFVLHEPTEDHVVSLCVRRLEGPPGLPRVRTFHLDGLQGGEGDREVGGRALGCTMPKA